MAWFGTHRRGVGWGRNGMELHMELQQWLGVLAALGFAALLFGLGVWVRGGSRPTVDWAAQGEVWPFLTERERLDALRDWVDNGPGLYSWRVRKRPARYRALNAYADLYWGVEESNESRA